MQKPSVHYLVVIPLLHHNYSTDYDEILQLRHLGIEKSVRYSKHAKSLMKSRFILIILALCRLHPQLQTQDLLLLVLPRCGWIIFHKVIASPLQLERSMPSLDQQSEVRILLRTLTFSIVTLRLHDSQHEHSLFIYLIFHDDWLSN